MIKVLIADDDKNLRLVLAAELSSEGFDVSAASGGGKALEMLETEEYDIMLLDLKMEDMNGLEVLQKIKSGDLTVEVIVLTAYASVPTAVDAMKLGAYDYLTKPFKMEELKAIIQKAYEKKRLLVENLSLKTQIKRQCSATRIITGSPNMLEVLETINKFAGPEMPVLICGESGTGKELAARALHEASGRAEGPFIAINCGAIPENMLESELFGHEKGAFTGAAGRKRGLLELADNGTIFFDEIGEMPLLLQVKLLRAIETRSFMRLGAEKDISVNVRFVSATNRDLKSRVTNGEFRQDLYYRISTLIIDIPPLRQRKEDIPLLVTHFIRSMPEFKNRRFDDDALLTLYGYSWPGNVRELQNVVYRALLLSGKNVIGKEDLPGDLVVEKDGSSKRMEDIERTHILMVLEDVGGHKGKAAEILGIDPKTLYRKLLNYGIK